jgi:hypothetical protein
MISPRRVAVAGCARAALSCLLGCGGFFNRLKKTAEQAKEEAEVTLELGQLAKSYLAYARAHKDRGPASSGEWQRWAQGKKDLTLARLIQETGAGGKYRFYWDVDVGKLPAGSGSTTVLGYESKAPESGGMVVMADGMTTKKLSDEDSASATRPPNAR